MADVITLAVEERERAGKGAARATRRAGRIPAVIYGNKQDPVLISLEPIELDRHIRGSGFYSSIYELEAGGAKHRVLARDLQLDPVSDRPLHVDFMRFSKKTRLVMDILVNFINEEECPGIRQGGVLNIVRHSIEMRCNPETIPESIELDLTGLEVGDSVHISALTLPDDVELTITDRDFTIATIAAPTIVEEVEEDEDGIEGEAGEAAEGEDADGEEGEAEE
jgi:large subunit ribosomal protein L25